MIRPIRASLAAVCTAALVAGLAYGSPVAADDAVPQDGVPAQSEVDGLTIGSNGGWAAMPGGIEARPFVKRLSVTNGDAETVVIDNAAGVPIPTPLAGTNLDVSITPYNLCQQGQAEQAGSCYRKPNRVGIIVGYLVDGNLHRNFDAPAAAGAGVGPNTVINLTVGLNTLGSTLRWSWVTGLPTSWQVTRLGQADGELRISFKPRLRPMTSNGGGCTQIPVSPTCEFTTGSSYERSAELLLSLDTTLDAAFTGALFATDKAYIGSLDVIPAGGQSVYPTMTWGMAAPTTVAGQPNSPQLWAFMSDAVLVNSFGVPPGASPRSVVSVAVDSGSGDPETGGWQQWTTEANGSAGWLITSGPVTVSTTLAAPTRSRAKTRVAKAVKVKATRRSAASVYVNKSKRQTVIAASASGRPARACGRAKCRSRIWKLGSATAVPKLPTLLSTDGVTATRGRLLASTIVKGKPAASLGKNDRVLVVIESKKGSSWNFLTSGIAIVK